MDSLGGQRPIEAGVCHTTDEAGVRSEYLDVFAERLAALRERQRRSRKSVSELCGLPPDAIRRYERKEARPSFGAVIAIADYFGVSIDYLVGRTNY